MPQHPLDKPTSEEAQKLPDQRQRLLNLRQLSDEPGPSFVKPPKHVKPAAKSTDIIARIEAALRRAGLVR
jgi:hypothetical protein